MKKKRKLSPQEFKIYKEQHDYEDIIAAEETKINNEKLTYTKLQEESKRQIKRRIQSIRQVVDLEILDDDLDDPEAEQIANSTIQNARTHINRLGGLKEYED